MTNKINLLKNLLVVIAFVIQVLLISGCSLFCGDEINIDDIFMQEESEYYIYFYKDDCSYCDNIKSEIEEFSLENTLYKINLSKKKNSLIARSYIDGEGSNNKYHVSGVTVYNELYISMVPALIKITNGKSIYIAGGVREIERYLNNEK